MSFLVFSFKYTSIWLLHQSISQRTQENLMAKMWGRGQFYKYRKVEAQDC